MIMFQCRENDQIGSDCFLLVCFNHAHAYRTDWVESEDAIVLTIYAKGVSKDSVTVHFTETTVGRLKDHKEATHVYTCVYIYVCVCVCVWRWCNNSRVERMTFDIYIYIYMLLIWDPYSNDMTIFVVECIY